MHAWHTFEIKDVAVHILHGRQIQNNGGHNDNAGGHSFKVGIYIFFKGGGYLLIYR